ncbi:hypothetical protein [Endozoicomonas ascidiicola]|uniref:hypothetical protein n=1 Tax=Endozoicomonas ascidiicola TaxID=1698521 RepID=UPI000830D6C3|nr:hypothetical protein [Endozoicomonas ascidiicola]
MENKNKEIQSFDELKEFASWFDPENYNFGTEPSLITLADELLSRLNIHNQEDISAKSACFYANLIINKLLRHKPLKVTMCGSKSTDEDINSHQSEYLRFSASKISLINQNSFETYGSK